MSDHHHRIETYDDGYFEVRFCTVCGAEGLQLFDKCGQVPIVKKPDWLIKKRLDDEREALDSNYDND